jgi:hypothetical protein
MGYLPNLKYLNSVVTDPLDNSNAFKYRYIVGQTQTTNNVCPNTNNGALTISGSKDFILRVKLEKRNDPDLKSSYSKCILKINNATSNPAGPIVLTGGGIDTTPPDGIDDQFYYYECND